MWRFHNPVDVVFGAGAIDRLSREIGGRGYVLVTYPEPEIFRRLADRLSREAGSPAALIDDTTANPDYHSLSRTCDRMRAADSSPELIVALGGGSVLDAAKVLAASGGDFGRVRRFIETGQGENDLDFLPMLAVPTTAGTGSEVTCWATVWDTDAKKKYSLSHPRLFPKTAFIDPELTISAPRELTVSTGLDALSHALEAIWNRNANPVSSTLAVTAAKEILAVLPCLADDLGNIGLRTRMSWAATCAGLAFSNTRTALAHSLSYHFTLHHGVPHGIACSFSLPMVMRGSIGADPDCDASLKLIFGPDLAAGSRWLAKFLEALGVPTDAASHGIDADGFDSLVSAALAGERGLNYVGTRERLSAG